MAQFPPGIVNPLVPQEYTPLYVQINGTFLSEAQSVTINRMDGGASVETFGREWAGRVKGAPKAEVSIKGVIPYFPTDQSGEGFAAQGMTAAGTQLDQTMLTSLNGNGNAPVSFIISIGWPAAQQLIFQGYVISINVDAAIGKQSDFSIQCEGKFSVFQ